LALVRVSAGLLAAGLLTACTGSAPPDIRVAAVGRGTVTEVVQAPANVVARAAATVSAPAAGTVKAVLVKDGAHVVAGQVLLTLDSPSARAALATAQQADRQAAASTSSGTTRISTSGLTQADAAAATAFGTAKQAAELIPDPTLRAQALAQIAAAQAQYAAARSAAASALAQANAGLSTVERAAQSLAAAQRAQTRAALAAAQATVASLTVRSPIAGTVVLGGVSAGSSSGSASSLLSQVPSSLQSQAQALLGGSGAAADSGSGASVVGVLEPGTPVSAGSGLLTVTDVSTLTLSALVDETDILLVKPGVRADVDFDAVPDASYPATVTSIDLAPTTSSRGGVSYLVRLSLGAGTTSDGTPAPQPRPGMSAVASLDVLTATDAVSVPAAAVFRDATGSGSSVWLVSGGKATRREVTLGAQGDTVIQILTGVRPGDRIVVKGADKVVEGQQVEGS
jgi:multidrug efflux pump subunit AcrA (membrane-fusion protein)